MRHIAKIPRHESYLCFLAVIDPLEQACCLRDFDNAPPLIETRG